MNNDIKVLRQLAREYAAALTDPRNAERRALQTAVNDLKMVRPVVLIDEIPWAQMNYDGSLTCHCKDPFFQSIENGMRKDLFKFRNFPGDFVLKPYIGVSKIVHSTGIGLDVQDATLQTGNTSYIVSHAYVDQLQNPEDVEKLKLPTLTYDKEATDLNWNTLGDAIGDIVPIRKISKGFYYFAPWDQLPRYHGVENCYLDLMDRPEFMHALMRKMTDIALHEIQQMEEQGILCDDPSSLHCTPSYVSDLPGQVGDKITRKNIWGRGMAQIFGDVSRDIHEEFDLQYQQEVIGSCGLAYYGCCEALHNKVDLVGKIPNLRKIGCTPWANTDMEAECVGKKYVLSVKTNPAAVAVPKLNEEDLRKNIKHILDAAHRNGCSVDITLKDISTCNDNYMNLVEWERIVMEMVRNY